MSLKASIKRLSVFTSCDIGDALVKLKYPYGGFLDGIHMWSPAHRSGPHRTIGQAITVKMVTMSDTDAPKPERHFADCNEPGKIMYIQQPKGLYSACWGGLMSTRASALRAGGAVVDGRIRDINEHRELGFPVSLLSLTSSKLISGFCTGYLDFGVQYLYSGIRNERSTPVQG